jgi:hypothetical protein
LDDKIIYVQVYAYFSTIRTFCGSLAPSPQKTLIKFNKSKKIYLNVTLINN